ncbi:hypothetical protein DRQ18_04050 [bacterium]|nr:MAG: hypothetical protein DRQ18_04050 [bacterium]
MLYLLLVHAVLDSAVVNAIERAEIKISRELLASSMDEKQYIKAAYFLEACAWDVRDSVLKMLEKREGIGSDFVRLIRTWDGKEIVKIMEKYGAGKFVELIKEYPAFEYEFGCARDIAKFLKGLEEAGYYVRMDLSNYFYWGDYKDSPSDTKLVWVNLFEKKGDTLIESPCLFWIRIPVIVLLRKRGLNRIIRSLSPDSRILTLATIADYAEGFFQQWWICRYISMMVPPEKLSMRYTLYLYCSTLRFPPFLWRLPKGVRNDLNLWKKILLEMEYYCPSPSNENFLELFLRHIILEYYARECILYLKNGGTFREDEVCKELLSDLLCHRHYATAIRILNLMEKRGIRWSLAIARILSSWDVRKFFPEEAADAAGMHGWEATFDTMTIGYIKIYQDGRRETVWVHHSLEEIEEERREWKPFIKFFRYALELGDRVDKWILVSHTISEDTLLKVYSRKLTKEDLVEIFLRMHPDNVKKACEKGKLYLKKRLFECWDSLAPGIQKEILMKHGEIFTPEEVISHVEFKNDMEELDFWANYIKQSEYRGPLLEMVCNRMWKILQKEKPDEPEYWCAFLTGSWKYVRFLLWKKLPAENKKRWLRNVLWKCFYMAEELPPEKSSRIFETIWDISGDMDEKILEKKARSKMKEMKKKIKLKEDRELVKRIAEEEGISPLKLKDMPLAGVSPYSKIDLSVDDFLSIVMKYAPGHPLPHILPLYVASKTVSYANAEFLFRVCKKSLEFAHTVQDSLETLETLMSILGQGVFHSPLMGFKDSPGWLSLYLKTSARVSPEAYITARAFVLYIFKRMFFRMWLNFPMEKKKEIWNRCIAPYMEIK